MAAEITCTPWLKIHSRINTTSHGTRSKLLCCVLDTAVYCMMNLGTTTAKAELGLAPAVNLSPSTLGLTPEAV